MDTHQDAKQTEQQALLETAQTQSAQQQRYERTRQQWKTVQSPEGKWVRVPLDALAAEPAFRTIRQGDRWVRVPC